MKLYILENAPRFSGFVEEADSAGGGASSRVDRFVAGTPADVRESVRVRIHYAARKPWPLPDLCRGERLLFASERAKTIIERHFGIHVSFAPVDIIGFGVDDGRLWQAAPREASPFGELPRYHVVHVTHTADVLDETRSMIFRDSIGELPQLLPVGQFECMAFDRGAEIPPVFAMPYHAGLAVFSTAFIDVLKREQLTGLKPVEAFDSDFDTVFEGDEAEAALVSLREARHIAAALESSEDRSVS